jgi:hypothetical protein
MTEHPTRWGNWGQRKIDALKSEGVTQSIIFVGAMVWIIRALMASKLQCDDVRWPLVILTAPVQWGADSVVRYIEETTLLVERGSPFALVFDLTGSALPAPSARSRLAAHRHWLYSRAGDRLLLEGVVVSSRAQQETFIVSGEQQAMHTAQRFFVNLEAATSLALSRIGDAGLLGNAGSPRSSGVSYRPPRKAFASEPEFAPTTPLPLRRFS